MNCVCIYGQTNVDDILKSYLSDPTLKHAQISYCVMDANSGKIIKECNSETGMIPASTLKIITTGAALGILGKNYTYKTNYYFVQKSDSATDISEGDIIVKGSGDPSFNSAYFYKNDSMFFLPVIKSLKAKGIKNISGSIKTDNSIFDNLIPATWIWSDIGNYFGAGANGLSYKDNKFSLIYSTLESGSTAKLESISPAYFLKTISVQSNVKAYGAEDEAVAYGNPYENTRYVSGNIPPNQKNYEVEVQAPNPEVFFLFSLRNELFANKLITKKDKTFSPSIEKTELFNYKTASLFYTHISPTLDKIIFYTNTKSNNHYAESLLKTIGAVKNEKTGSTENGIKAIENYWKARGVDVTGLHMSDGCGLSRANTVTTKLQATILSKIYNDSLIYQSFNASLPVAGKTGSMINLCKGTFAENNMRAKTGYINRARGYCGYVKTKVGTELAFSILFNNYDCTAKEAKLKIEKFLIALAEMN